MSEKINFQEIGDHRDVPMSLGLLIIAWNACEVQARELLRTLASGGRWANVRLSEVLIFELGSVGLSQALNCYANEFPDENKDLTDGILFATKFLERARAYRNYYVHGIDGVTAYGFIINEETLNNDTPLHEAMEVGPFGKIFSRSAKSKVAFAMNFVRAEKLANLNNQLAELADYMKDLHLAINHYVRGLAYRDSAPLPQRPPLPDAFQKPVLSHPKLKPLPALSLERLHLTSSEDEGEN